jgi:hypothetical protein
VFIVKQKELFEADYVVQINGSRGREILCNTVAQVYKAIGLKEFGGRYSVRSPTGKDVSQFVPF